MLKPRFLPAWGVGKLQICLCFLLDAEGDRSGVQGPSTKWGLQPRTLPLLQLFLPFPPTDPGLPTLLAHLPPLVPSGDFSAIPGRWVGLWHGAGLTK